MSIFILFLYDKKRDIRSINVNLNNIICGRGGLGISVYIQATQLMMSDDT